MKKNWKELRKEEGGGGADLSLRRAMACFLQLSRTSPPGVGGSGEACVRASEPLQLQSSKAVGHEFWTLDRFKI